LAAFARVSNRLLRCAFGDADALQADPAFSSPIKKPIAPPPSPKIIVQVGEPWIPSLCSTECALASFRAPSDPSALSRNFGTRNNEMPRVPGGASGNRASTKWMMLSVKSCSP
jgi:hypothetical protein